VIIILLAAFVVVAIAALVFAAMVKLQVNRMLPEDQRFPWWSRATSSVYAMHRELFPDSLLADIALGSFWLAILLLGVMVYNLVF
jgi:hypothetical protein